MNDKEKSRDQLLQELAECRRQCRRDASALRLAEETAEGRERELTMSEQQFKALVENAPDIIARYDKDHRYLYVNPAIATLKGVLPEALIGKKLGVVMSDDLGLQLREMVDEAIRTRSDKTVEWEYETKSGIRYFQTKLAPEFARDAADGTPRIFRTRFTPEFSREGEVLSVLGITRDVTELKSLEAELRRAKEDAERANRAKSMFLANMSHEIRTPMNGMVGMIELALMTSANPLVQNYLEMAKQSGRALIELINDILDISKIESGKAELVQHEFSLRRAVESAVKPFEVMALEKGLEFGITIDEAIPDALLGDQGRLRQVLINLIGNAIKFTPRGRVAVTITLDEISQPLLRLCCTVTDNGIGIPGEKLNRVFETFTQVHPEQAVYEGVGLGLAISKQLVEMMGGEIWVESVAGEGSSFFFTATFGLAAEGKQATTRAAAAVAPAMGQLRILLAEDDKVNRLLAVELLMRRGHHVEMAWNGLEALEKLKAGNFDLVLMDVRMPDMNGPEAVAAIRRGEAGLDKVGVTVVALTAYALKGDRERFLEQGMDDYLAKPIDTTELDRVLAEVMSMRDAGARSAQIARPQTGQGHNQKK